jgi:hypothetical protein
VLRGSANTDQRDTHPITRTTAHARTHTHTHTHTTARTHAPVFARRLCARRGSGGRDRAIRRRSGRRCGGGGAESGDVDDGGELECAAHLLARPDDGHREELAEVGLQLGAPLLEELLTGVAHQFLGRQLGQAYRGEASLDLRASEILNKLKKIDENKQYN